MRALVFAAKECTNTHTARNPGHSLFARVRSRVAVRVHTHTHALASTPCTAQLCHSTITSQTKTITNLVRATFAQQVRSTRMARTHARTCNLAPHRCCAVRSHAQLPRYFCVACAIVQLLLVCACVCAHAQTFPRQRASSARCAHCTNTRTRTRTHVRDSHDTVMRVRVCAFESRPHTRTRLENNSLFISRDKKITNTRTRANAQRKLRGCIGRERGDARLARAPSIRGRGGVRKRLCLCVCPFQITVRSISVRARACVVWLCCVCLKCKQQSHTRARAQPERA